MMEQRPEERREELGETQERPPDLDQEQETDRETASLEKELDQTRQALQDYERRLLRLQADFDNFRKRMQKEQARWGEEAQLELVKSLLPVVDNLERALDQEGGDPDSIRQGVEMIYRQLREVLGQYGVERIAARGQPFDPNFHEAVMTEETGEEPEGTVLEEFRTGYTMGSRLLRPCSVKVASRSREEDKREDSAREEDDGK